MAKSIEFICSRMVFGCNVFRYGECLKVWPDFVALDTDFTNQWPRYDQRACENYCIEAEKYRRCGCVTDYYGMVLTCGLSYHRPPILTGSFYEFKFSS